MLTSSDVSVFRTEESLQEGVRKITEVDQRFANVGIRDRSMIWNSDLVETLELQNLLTNATVLCFKDMADYSKRLLRQRRERSRVELMLARISRNEMMRSG